MRNGLASLVLMLTGFVLSTASCGSDEATGGGSSCKKEGESYAVKNSSSSGSCCDGLTPLCDLTQTSGPGGVMQSNGTCTCRMGGSGGGLLGGGGTSGAGGTSGRGGTSGTGGSVGSPNFGASCSTTADCDDPMLTCLMDDGLSGGGPAGGLCTRACTSDTQCLELSNDAYCIDFDTNASYCVQGCITGGAGVPKCQSRTDLSCTLLGLLPTNTSCASTDDCLSGQLCSTSAPRVCGDIVTGCLPTCGGDFDCGSGQFCDFSTGLCTDSEPSGLPIGAPCDPNAATDPCNGFCVPSDSTGNEGSCAAFCSFSSAFTGCGWDGTGLPDAGCLFPTILSPPGDLGAGNVGICGSLCDCNADCVLSSESCIDDTAGEILNIFGREGYCRPLQSGETAADTLETCPAGHMTGTGGSGSGGNGGQGGA